MVILHINFVYFLIFLIVMIKQGSAFILKRFKPDTIFHLKNDRWIYRRRVYGANKGRDGNRRIIKYLLKTN